VFVNARADVQGQVIAALSRPLVSVLTPSLNQAPWLSDNLRSVACQTYPRIEHVVVDGESSDGTQAILERAAASVRWISEPDQGQADALNKALAMSSGEIVAWLNSDDGFFDHRVVEDVVGFLEDHPEADVVYGHAACVDAGGRILHYFWAPRFSRRRLRLYDYIVQPAVFFRRSAVEAQFVDDRLTFALDYELWLRLMRTHTFLRFDRLVAIDRMQPERKSRTRLPERDRELATLAEKYGVRTSPAARAVASLHHVWCRLRGAGLALQAPADLAFSGDQDGRGALLWRQVAQRRAKMAT
jgi:glycosyltransferase involved in cell wall biosynthesis